MTDLPATIRTIDAAMSAPTADRLIARLSMPFERFLDDAGLPLSDEQRAALAAVREKAGV